MTCIDTDFCQSIIKNQHNCTIETEINNIYIGGLEKIRKSESNPKCYVGGNVETLQKVTIVKNENLFTYNQIAD